MEHIRKALEQAEKDRAEVKSQQRPAAEQPPSSGPTSDENNPNDNGPVEVKYQSTKVVDVPDTVFEKNRLIAALAGHELSDSYSMLRTRVLQKMTANNWNALALTSPATGHGKTLTAINLAISLAREVNHTVLLADLDLRNPSVHEYFDYQPTAGLSDYLQSDVPLSEVLFSPGIDRLVVLPGRESMINSSETLGAPKMVSLISELKNRYPDRLIICDLPPILATDDALAFTPYIDAMLMVAEAGGTLRKDLEEALRILKQVPLLGTVLNRAETSSRRKKPYGYGSD
jgi:capsular exopolysaccharide synthesis family protein